MKDLIIAGTRQTPEVSFLLDGSLTISGISTPENVNKFYDPIIVWLELLERALPKNISLTVDFEYINTSSQNILLFQLFPKIVSFTKQNTELKVIWVFPNGDDDIEDLGKNMEDVLKHKFNFICK